MVLDQSLLRSGRAELEYLIFDRASSYGTAEILHSFENRGVTVVSEPDAGFYAALAKGLQETTGNKLRRNVRSASAKGVVRQEVRLCGQTSRVKRR